MRKICFFTGSRAEYGILSRLVRKVSDDPDLQLQIIATNMHLSPEYGHTYKEIEKDGFHIDKKVEMLLSSDTPNGTVKSMGLATIGFADAIEELKPDLVVILGDRFEMLSAAQTCLIYQIPIAHIAGGSITEGAYDDAIRHCITKMSHLHFTSTQEHRNRVIQLGENPNRVFWSGSLGVDNIHNEPVLSLEELEKDISFKLGNKYMIVTFHPVTTEFGTMEEQCNNLLSVLHDFNDEYKLLFTLPNSDAEGRIIVSKVREYVNKHNNQSIAITSLGKKRYYSALKYATLVVDNSSSGLIEAPSFHIPTLNIGNRQHGRTRGQSIIDVSPTKEGIREGLHLALSPSFIEKAKKADNPYEKANTLDTIFNIIKNIPLNGLNKKQFYNLQFHI